MTPNNGPTAIPMPTNQRKRKPTEILSIVLNNKAKSDLAVVRHYAEAVLHMEGRLSGSQLGQIALAVAAKALQEGVSQHLTE